MSTAEIPYALSRREFLFAKGKSRSNRQPSRQAGPHRPPTQPKPPEKDGHKITRRQFIPLAGVGAAAGIGILARALEPWNWFTPKPEPSQPETLESLVTQAKRMEDDYRFQDLSNRPIREKYASILAGIFAFHYPEYFSRQQLVETISWDDSLDQFVRDRMASAGKTGTPTANQLANERETTAATSNRMKKIIVNVAANAFQQRNINLISDIPKGWNPLTTLRISLFHEFNHLVTESSDEVIFAIIDPTNSFRDKRLEGFRFMGIDQKGNFVGAFNDLHEGVIELLAKDISQADFGSHRTDFLNESTGENITVLMARLETVLQVTGISHQQLARLHKNSNFREFLLLLTDKAGVAVSTPLSEKLRIGSLIIGAIERNDQRLLQQYLDQVRSINPTNSQK